MKELSKIQRQAAIWITGAFRTSPSGAVESLAGLMPVHLHLCKLASRSHARLHTLADAHMSRMVALDVYSPMIWHNPALLTKVKSLMVDLWANQYLVSDSLNPFHPYNQPGERLLDRFPKRVKFDIVLISGLTKDDRSKARKERLSDLNKEFDRSVCHVNRAVIVSDASVPLLNTGHQAVAA